MIQDVIVEIQFHNSRIENCKRRFCIAKGKQTEEEMTFEFPGLFHDEAADEMFWKTCS